MEKGFYKLPELPYGLDSLEPVISETQLGIHYTKHHKSYVEKANEILGILDSIASDESSERPDIGILYRKLTFNVGGIVLHNLYWKSMRSPGGENIPSSNLMEIIERNFGSLHSLKMQFSELAVNIEGSGWAVIFHCTMTGRLLIAPIQSHNLNIYPGFKPVLALDMWEHAYYLDYKNDKKGYIQKFWEIANWDQLEKDLGQAAVS